MNPFAGRAARLLVFDLDGTLFDSLEEIAESLNAVRLARGLSPLPLGAVRTAIGAGARALLERTSGAELGPGADLDEAYARLLAEYRVRCARAPRLYPGAREFLASAGRDAALAVFTNKPLEIALLTLEAAGLASAFARVLAPENAPRKPDPAGLLALMEEFAAAKEETVLFGDSVSDFAAGRAAGVLTVGMRGGYYRPGEPDPDLWAEGWERVRGWWEEARRA